MYDPVPVPHAFLRAARLACLLGAILWLLIIGMIWLALPNAA